MKLSFVINFLYTRKLGLSVITAVAYDDGMTPYRPSKHTRKDNSKTTHV